MIWAAVAAAAFLRNLAPAFRPPPWAVLAGAHLQFDLPTLPLAAVGAASSTAGRYLLAVGSREFGERFVPRHWEANLHALAQEFERHPTLGLPFLVLFMLGPVPSNHVFIAAGMSEARLPPLLALFAVSRFVSYLLWIEATSAVTGSLVSLLSPAAGGWAAALIQVAGIAVLIALMQVDWASLFRRLDRTRSGSGGAGGVVAADRDRASGE
ncbi:MAG: hypothetical protein ACKOWF_11595 [Chloroflexota bacterium]